MSKKITVKLTRLGRREAKAIMRERAREAKFSAKMQELERERWAAEEARKYYEGKSLAVDVKNTWKRYHETKDPRLKEKVGRMMKFAEEEGIELVS